MHQLTVKELREWLERFEDDAIVYGYEGEISGIVCGDEWVGNDVDDDA